MSLLLNKQVLALTGNLPGPLFLEKISELGARVIKIEPLDGDPLKKASSRWYEKIHKNISVVSWNLNLLEDREKFFSCLSGSDLFFTTNRQGSLKKLDLDFGYLKRTFSFLSFLQLQSWTTLEDLPAHDINLEAHFGLMAEKIPKSLFVDLTASQLLTQAALELLLGKTPGTKHVSLEQAAEFLALPLKHSLTSTEGILGGKSPLYNIYPTKDGAIVLAVLEKKFQEKLSRFCSQDLSREKLKKFFLTKTTAEWEKFSRENCLPISAIH